VGLDPACDHRPVGWFVLVGVKSVGLNSKTQKSALLGAFF